MLWVAVEEVFPVVHLEAAHQRPGKGQRTGEAELVDDYIYKYQRVFFLMFGVVTQLGYY